MTLRQAYSSHTRSTNLLEIPSKAGSSGVRVARVASNQSVKGSILLLKAPGLWLTGMLLSLPTGREQTTFDFRATDTTHSAA